ncbi:hypothetical protein P171DRAFT_428504 [Karstenula rhodostoma CBS 690.94]|uniref:CENP-V/GFA domain-containing protein n=1 Tax=Karstenula rhodostoma CBS 690.94 TaxID=1392251 RepID=A0A9P4PT23_9PLEO|nr:hypothetical protein P171DRAFT_428504 [Karstenula rhodostoma CBS 690.94]
MTEDTRITRSVRCNCGKVSFTVTGIDKLAVHCYCTNCQRTTGSAFAHNHRFSEASIAFDRGEEFVKQYADGNTDSKRLMLRHFCINCGSPLFLKSTAVADFIAVHEGSTTDKTKSQPVLELFAHEKYPWIGDVKGEYGGPPPFPWDPQP